jgi:PKD repeat protein
VSISVMAQLQRSLPVNVKTIPQPVHQPTETLAPVRGTVTQDFESYADFSLVMSPWTTVDVDGSATYGITNYTFLHQYEPMAFMVFNPASTVPTLSGDPYIQPHGGAKFAACFASTTPPNNDWIMSPQIELGSNGHVKFWVKAYTDQYGQEKYNVGVSTTTPSPASFTLLNGNTPLVAPAAAWQQMDFDLSAYSGQSIYIGIQCVSNDQFIFMLDDMEITSETVTGSTLTGMVTDAINGNPIANALVSVGGLEDYTDQYGNYTITGIPAGVLNANFTATPTNGTAPLPVQFTDLSSEGSQTVTASATGYTTYTNNQVVIPAGGTLELQISLSPTLASGQYRFVLTWGETPYDIDSHLKTPVIEGAAYHIFYGDQGSATSPPYAILDIDDQVSFGPETITIYELKTGEYHYYIHNYSQSPDITTSNAVVQIYNDNGLMQTLQVPTSGSGLYWDVCTLNGSNGNISVINQITNTEPGGLPKLTPEQMIKKPAPANRNIVSWSWNFGDGGTSTAQNPSHTYTVAGTYNVSLTISDGSANNTETKNAFIVVSGGGGNSTLTGMVTDAINGNPIANALVSIAGLTDYTDASGNYTINNIPAGILNANFTATPTTGTAPLPVQFTDLSSEGSHTVTASATGYTNYSNDGVVIPAGGTLELQISLSPTLASGQYRFVLTWGETPYDVDSHLKTPSIEGNTYHIFYGNQGSATSPPYAILDIDDQVSFGPETITIYELKTGEYHYYVHNYSQSPDITTSNSVVQIYNDNGLMQTLQVPTSGSGLYWDVCTLNGSNGNISIINQITNTEPGGLPKLTPEQMIKNSIPVSRNIVSWSWTFGDGGTSTAQNPSHTYTVAGTYNVSLTISDGTNNKTETKNAYIVVGGGGGNSTLTGMVTDAINGNPIPNALVSVAGLTDYTDASGNYSITGIPAGLLNANFNATPTSGSGHLAVQFTDQSAEGTHTVTASATGYTNYSNSQVVIPAGGSLELQISLSPTLASGQYRFVLTWGELPYDVDSHLKTPTIEGNNYHIFYGDQGSATSPPYAILDIDDQVSFGPETITIYELKTGEYHYYIHNYSQSPDITTSSAVVQIFNENGLLQTLQVPTSGTGLYWDVCTLNGTNGSISVINQITNTEPGGLPKLTAEQMRKTPIQTNRNIVSWSWDFGDTGTSNLQNPSHTYLANGSYTVSLTVSDGTNNDTETKNAYITVGPIGLDEASWEKDINIYPNPAKDQININSGIRIESVTIFDINGQQKMRMDNSGFNYSINLGNLPDGTYILRITTEKGMAQRKMNIKR